MIDISIFCYGTLQSQQRNSHYCEGAKSIEKAIVCGKLYQLPPGYPGLEIPEESILWRGTRKILADAQKQYVINDEGDFEFKIHDTWDTVHGELVTFADAEKYLPSIDALEGFPRYYDRLLVPVKKADGIITTAYVYTTDDIYSNPQYLPDGIWPQKKEHEK
jgi:gamma-glutamylcyclotransferase (GGCT)/AIG2-like uncharacterized protein YtfP